MPLLGGNITRSCTFYVHTVVLYGRSGFGAGFAPLTSVFVLKAAVLVLLVTVPVGIATGY